MESNPDPSRRLVVFLDVDTCIEGNYPIYDASDNYDIRLPKEKWNQILDKSCKYIKRAAESPALTANKGSRLVLLDCGYGPFYNIKDVCGEHSASRMNDGGWGNVLDNDQVIIAYYGIEKRNARPVDIGLPPPAVKPIELRPHELYDLQTSCGRRDFLFSFQGRAGYKRDRLEPLDNGKDVYVRLTNPEMYWTSKMNTTRQVPNMYDDIMRNSMFSGAPKGDCLWSYRFTEVMSAGAVPVVYDKDWLPPFSSYADPDRVVNWTKCSVLIGRHYASTTSDVLRRIPDDVRCEMQRCSFAFWNEFSSTREGWLKAILLWINRDPEIAKTAAKPLPV